MAIDNKDNIADENSVGQESFADEEDDFLDESDPEDALLLEALRTYDDEMLDKFFSENDDEKPVPLSCEGREKMEELLGQWLGPQKAQQVLKKEEKQYQQELRRWKQQRRRQMFSRVPRWCFAAAAALLAVIIGVANPKSSLAFKLPQINFIGIGNEERTKFHIVKDEHSVIDSEQLNYISSYYYLSEIAEGFFLSEKIDLEHTVIYKYNNRNGDSYFFTQQLVENNVGINTEQNDYTVINSAYGDAYYFDTTDVSGLIWNYNGYLFKIEGKLSQQELLKLQKSLKKEKGL